MLNYKQSERAEASSLHRLIQLIYRPDSSSVGEERKVQQFSTAVHASEEKSSPKGEDVEEKHDTNMFTLLVSEKTSTLWVVGRRKEK